MVWKEIPSPNIVETFPEIMRHFTTKENHIVKAVSEILRYTHTETFSCYFLFKNDKYEMTENEETTSPEKEKDDNEEGESDNQEDKEGEEKGDENPDKDPLADKVSFQFDSESDSHPLDLV